MHRFTHQWKKRLGLAVLLLVICLGLAIPAVHAQCSICTRTAQQLGEKPAKSLNAAILYLMAIPFCVMGFIGYRWWKNEYGNH
jgi:TRAP-type C4-dicarboxylate transport system permease small subunit